MIRLSLTLTSPAPGLTDGPEDPEGGERRGGGVAGGPPCRLGDIGRNVLTGGDLAGGVGLGPLDLLSPCKKQHVWRKQITG